MKRLLVILAALAPLALGGCALFSGNPGKVTSQIATTEAGGVFGSAIQPANGYGCPSILGQGAQTMGSLDAVCTDHGANQSIHLSAPDPNPALTTAFNGINQQMTTLQAIIGQLLQAAAAGAGGPAAGTAAGLLKPPAAPTPLGPLPSTTITGQGVTTTP